jgi:hypothetical protein
MSLQPLVRFSPEMGAERDAINKKPGIAAGLFYSLLEAGA